MYTGYVAAGRGDRRGSGANPICLHSNSERSKADDRTLNRGYGAVLFGAQYEMLHGTDPARNGNVKNTENHNEEAACAVCELDNLGDAYVQWGRSGNCTNDHQKLYSGYVMSSRRTHRRSSFLCVDSASEKHVYSSSGDQGPQSLMLYVTETEVGSLPEGDDGDGKYTDNRELGCSVCFAPKAVFTQWGSNTCGAGSTQLYKGYAAGVRYDRTGGGANNLCLHSSPQSPAVFNDQDSTGGNSAEISGVEYTTGDVKSSSSNYFFGFPLAKGRHQGDAACSVCMMDDASSVYTQWGRSRTCSNGHKEVYSGLVMGARHNDRTGEFVCVSSNFDVRNGSSSAKSFDSHRWYPAETRSHDEDSATNEGADLVYRHGVEVGCTVCAAPKATYVAWGSSTCGGNSKKLYEGIPFGAAYSDTGSGYNTLCAHISPEFPKGFGIQESEFSARLYQTVYQDRHNPTGDANLVSSLAHNLNRYATCSVCELEDADSHVVVQWGRARTCTNGGEALYNGFVMATDENAAVGGGSGATTDGGKNEFLCVNTIRATRADYLEPKSTSALSARIKANWWMPTAYEADPVGQYARSGVEQAYFDDREVACTVCKHTPNWIVEDRAASVAAAASDAEDVADALVARLDQADQRFEALLQYTKDLHAYIASFTSQPVVTSLGGCGSADGLGSPGNGSATTSTCPDRATLTGTAGGDVVIKSKKFTFESDECGATDVCETQQVVQAMYKKFTDPAPMPQLNLPTFPVTPPLTNGTTVLPSRQPTPAPTRPGPVPGSVRSTGGANVTNSEPFYPEVYFAGRWWPVCKNQFKDNSYGARAMCMMLGAEGGAKGPEGGVFTADAMQIGRCNKNEDIDKCTGSSNRWGEGLREIDTKLSNGPIACEAGRPIGIKIICSGCPDTGCIPTPTNG